MTIRFIVILLGASLLAACGQAAVSNTNPVAATSTQSSSTSSTADACSLLTQDEVSTVLGQAVTGSTSSGLGGACTYTTKDFRFALSAINTGGIKYMQSIRTNVGANAIVVPGLGDDALFNTNSNSLIVLKGDGVYLFDLSDTNYSFPQDGQAKLQALAAQLLSHLP
jgi:hypothetical protein